MDLNQIIKNAKRAAIRDGYGQIVIKDIANESYSFERDYRPLNIFLSGEKVIGEVKINWNLGAVSVVYNPLI